MPPRRKLVLAEASPSIESFWAFAAEREAIRLRRAAGDPEPWTDDPILYDFHFCNVRRRDDSGTQWYLGHVVRGGLPLNELIFRTVFYRVVNNPEWFVVVGGFGRKGFTLSNWHQQRPFLAAQIRRGPEPYNLAYVRSLIGGVRLPRRTKVIQALDSVAKQSSELSRISLESESLEEVWRALDNVAHVGPFVAMQIYRDLFLVGALGQLDEDSFVFIGNGAQVGARLLGVTGYRAQEQFCHQLWREQPRELLADGPIALADVEHLMCETAKYWRLAAWQRGEGPRPKLRYRRGVAR